MNNHHYIFQFRHVLTVTHTNCSWCPFSQVNNTIKLYTDIAVVIVYFSFSLFSSKFHVLKWRFMGATQWHCQPTNDMWQQYQLQ